MKAVKVEFIKNPLLGYVDGRWFRLVYENGRGVAIDLDISECHEMKDVFDLFIAYTRIWCENPYGAFFMYALAMPKQFRPEFWYPDEMAKDMTNSDIDMRIKRQLQGILIKMKEDFNDLLCFGEIVRVEPEEPDTPM